MTNDGQNSEPRRFSEAFGKRLANSPGLRSTGGGPPPRHKRWGNNSNQEESPGGPAGLPASKPTAVRTPEKVYDTSEPIDDYSRIPPSLLTLLQGSWCLWYTSGPVKTAENFEDCLIPVGAVSTAEAFWALYSHCIRPSALPKGTEYHLFREGIRPMWEDPANMSGGTLMIRLKKSYLDYYWEALILAMIGEELGPDICGAVAGKRFTDDHLSLWNRQYDEGGRERLSSLMLSALNLPLDCPTDYKSHVGSLSHTGAAVHGVSSAAQTTTTAGPATVDTTTAAAADY